MAYIIVCANDNLLGVRFRPWPRPQRADAPEFVHPLIITHVRAHMFNHTRCNVCVYAMQCAWVCSAPRRQWLKLRARGWPSIIWHRLCGTTSPLFSLQRHELAWWWRSAWRWWRPPEGHSHPPRASSVVSESVSYFTTTLFNISRIWYGTPQPL